MSPVPQPAETSPVSILTPEQQQSSDNLSDRVAMAALILGGGAFVIAFLQMIYQYVTSTLRDKTSRGAIGVWHKFVKTTFDLRSWRLRVLYPEVTLNIQEVLDARECEDYHVRRLLKPLQEKNYMWVDIPGALAKTPFIHVSHSGWAFQRPGTNEPPSELNIVKCYELPIARMIEWFRFLWKNPRHTTVPARASWANMLECLDVDPHAVCTRMQLADIIPGVLDAPYQNTTLINIGLWCFVLGMKDLNLILRTVRLRHEIAMPVF